MAEIFNNEVLTAQIEGIDNMESSFPQKTLEVYKIRITHAFICATLAFLLTCCCTSWEIGKKIERLDIKKQSSDQTDLVDFNMIDKFTMSMVSERYGEPFQKGFINEDDIWVYSHTLYDCKNKKTSIKQLEIRFTNRKSNLIENSNDFEKVVSSIQYTNNQNIHEK